MNLAICCPSTGGHEAAVATWQASAAYQWTYSNDVTIEGLGAGYLHKAEKFYQENSADILAYFHNDLYIHTFGWDAMVLQQFEDPSVGVVSFCGAMRHGHPDIYKVPYDYRQLARFEFISNMMDAELHGQRVLQPRDVAVVDSFSLIVRRSLLARVDGWLNSGLLDSHCSDYWICLMAHRHKMKVRYIPVYCTHHSGGVRGDGRFDYAKWQAWYGFTDAEMHQYNHRLLYDEFRDVLPVRVDGL